MYFVQNQQSYDASIKYKYAFKTEQASLFVIEKYYFKKINKSHVQCIGTYLKN